MHVSEGGGGWFVSLSGGGKPWSAFRIVSVDEGLFGGQVINGGSVSLKPESSLRAVVLHEAQHLSSI